jgi:hypothetical protein
MAQETCEYHTQLVADIAVLKDNTSYIRNTVCKHIEEGERDGGYRDRLLILEQAVSELKKAMWVRVIVSGFIGGLLGTGSSDAIGVVIKWIMK